MAGEDENMCTLYRRMPYLYHNLSCDNAIAELATVLPIQHLHMVACPEPELDASLKLGC